MSPKILSIVFAFLATAMLSLTAIAQTPDQERIKQLEQENDVLRQQLAQLRLELSQLKREMEKLATKADDAEPEPGEPVEGSDIPDAGQEVADPNGNDKDNDKDKARTFRTADEIYRSIPQDMRPARDGWDVVQRRTVENWLNTNITGKRFEARKKITTVEVDYDDTGSIWEVTLGFEHEEMRFMSWEMQEQLEEVVLRGDQDFAEKARKKYKTGGTVNVSGTISQIEWSRSIIKQNAEENWHPKYCELTLDAVQIK